MAKSEKESVFSSTDESITSHQLWSSEVTTNQILYAQPHTDKVTPSCFTDAEYFCQRQHRGGQLWGWPAGAVQHQELMYHTQPEDRGANFYHPYPANTRQRDMRGECSCWDCGLKQCGATEAANRDTYGGEDPHQSDEELEPPLPLRSDDEWQQYSPFHSHHYMLNNYGLHMEVRCHSAGTGHNSLGQVNRYWPQTHQKVKRGACNDVQMCLHDSCMNDRMTQTNVSVNVPQFSLPPVEGISQFSVKNLSSEGAEAPVLHPPEMRTVHLPDACRNIFITYSSDVCSEMVTFVDFLTKQGFHPTIDIFDNSVRCMDTTNWKDSHLKDSSNLIIIAISPKYKADIEGLEVDSHGLRTKYIHFMMQNEFIQQGSLNFRFVPVLFLNASQKHVPSWLQNTHVYHWPHNAEDLLLRLLREERYVPPPVPVDPPLIIRPVTPAATTL